MIYLEIDLNLLEQITGAEHGLFHSTVAIVDNEIANDISSNWDYASAEIITTGVLYKDTATILLADKKDDKVFRKVTIMKLKEFAKRTELYALNRFMEQGNFKGFFGIDLDIKEIKPFKGKRWNKDRFFLTLVETGMIKPFALKDPLTHGGECIAEWAEFLRTGKKEHLYKIAGHNLNCLVKESIILKNKSYLQSLVKINKDGWVRPA